MHNITRLFDFINYQNETYPLVNAFADKKNGEWVNTSTESYIQKSNALSRALLYKGVVKNDNVAIITTNNCTYWNITDTAVLQIGCQTVPIYPNNSLEDFEYILNHSESKYCFVSDIELYSKINQIKSKLKYLVQVFTFNEIDDLVSINQLINLGETLDNQENVEELKNNVLPTDLASIIYTSGTTGKPKGVMLSHKNMVNNVISASKRVHLPLGKTKALSFLPCCHVFERVLLYCYQYKGYSVYFAESIEVIAENIKDVKPNMMTVVPRLLEKVYDKIISNGNELKGFKKILFFWAVKIAEQYEPYNLNGTFYNYKLKIAQKLVLKKFKEALGGELNLIISGSAAIQSRLPKFFTASGIQTVEGYGLTETSPVITVNDFKNNNYKSNTVGKPIDGVEVKIAADGEILTKSDSVMMGYYKDPIKTAEVIKDGFFHTEDIGEIDNDGFLKITDRKKEMFKTSGGKYVAPQVLENEFKKSRFIEQIMVVGEGEKMPGALIQPDFEYLKDWASKNNIHDDFNELINNEIVLKKYKEVINQTNQHFGNWEQVKVFALTNEIWAVNTGELTPTLKLKRKFIKEKFKAKYNLMYNH